MKKIQIGGVVGRHTLTTTESGHIEIPDSRNITHLQFRRFAGCPFCSVHLHNFVRRYDEIRAAGIQEVTVFRSTTAALQQHHANLPFAVIPDPEGRLYTEFGVGSGLGAVLSPRALLMALPNIIRMLPKLPGIPSSSKGTLGFPADFLIAPNGRVLALKYGSHADDQWSVDELLVFARQYAVDKRSF